MSFGFGLGDCLQVLQVGYKLRERFVDAPKQFHALSDEVRSLTIVLEDVKLLLPRRDLTSQQRKALVDVFVGCKHALDATEALLDRYNNLSKAGSHDAKAGQGIRTGWKRLKWEPEDVKDIRGRIASNISLLNAFYGNLTTQAINRLNERQEKQEQKEEHQALLKWLTPLDHALQQNDFTSKRQPGTGQWVLKSQEYQDWIAGDSQTLFCPGMPGAGKTMIASLVISELNKMCENDAEFGVAYLFCNFRRHEEQNVANFLSSVLKQLVQQQHDPPESLKTLYAQHQRSQTRPTVDDLVETLRSVISANSRTYVVVDALDEYQVSNEDRRRFLSALFTLRSSSNLSLFATSRLIPGIMNEFRSSPKLEIRASEEDVRKYVAGRMSDLPAFVFRNHQLQEEIKTEVVKVVDGMFLLAQLHMTSLMDRRSPKALKTALKALPNGSDAIDQAYQRAMERIQHHSSESRELAIETLSWITGAKLPLSPSELLDALSVEIGESELDPENRPDLEDVLGACTGLIIFDEEGQVIRLVHYTTQEYFDRHWKKWLPQRQNYITNVCATYLGFDVFDLHMDLKTPEAYEVLDSFPFYSYAAREWGAHHPMDWSEVRETVMRFLGSWKKVQLAGLRAVVIAMRGRISTLSTPFADFFAQQPTTLHITAGFGMSDAVRELLRTGQDVNSKDDWSHTVLSWAASLGNTPVVDFLLQIPGIDLNTTNEPDDATPLMLAASMGHISIVQLLLSAEGIDVNLVSKKTNMTALNFAIDEGQVEIAKLLIDAPGIQLDPQFDLQKAPLWTAAGSGILDLVKLLLSRGANVNVSNKRGETTLGCAALAGRTEMLQFLLTVEGVDVNVGSPLSYAVVGSHQDCVDILLAVDNIDINSKDVVAPLILATYRGDEVLVERLLRRPEIDVNASSSANETALTAALDGENPTIAKKLLQFDDIDVSIRDEDGQTAISLASAKGYEDLVAQILERDAGHLNSKDVEGNTPLSLAAEGGHTGVVRILLGREEIDVNCQNRNGDTPLVRALRAHAFEVVKLLAQRPELDVNILGQHQKHALTEAIWSESEEMIELILNLKGIDINAVDEWGRPPLFRAVRQKKLLKMLLPRDDLDVNIRDKQGRNALFYAMQRHYDGKDQGALGFLLTRRDLIVEYEDWWEEFGTWYVRPLLYEAASYQ